MCTAATLKQKILFWKNTGLRIFLRRSDYDHSKELSVSFRHAGTKQTHYAIIGMAHVAGGYPLYYDAINEKGVGMAGLNFVGNAAYANVKPDVTNVAQFEFIPWNLKPVCFCRGSSHTSFPHESGQYSIQRTVSSGAASLDHL